MIDAYLLGRTNLQCVFLLVDVRFGTAAQRPGHDALAR